LKTASQSQRETDDFGIDHKGIAEYQEMGLAIGVFLRANDDCRISLARHRGTGGWFIMINSLVGLGQLTTDMPNGTTPEQLIEQIGILYGRLGQANKQSARVIKKKIEKHQEEENWQDW
jgi:hypothetical protein